MITPFINSFSDYLNLRLINKNFKNHIYNSVCHNDILFPRSTFISIGHCWNCDTTENNVEQIDWLSDDPPRRTVVVCDYWRCRLIGFISKIYELYRVDKVFYFYPPLENKEYRIPRSNSKTVTIAKICNYYNNISFFRNEKFYVYVQWKEDAQLYRKLVLFKDFLSMNNIKENFTIYDMYEKSNLLQTRHLNKID